MPLVGFATTISAGEQPKTYALDRTATGTSIPQRYHIKIPCIEEHDHELSIARWAGHLAGTGKTTNKLPTRQHQYLLSR
jgi:hypothetical protein